MVRSNSVLFIDAGYLLASAATRRTGSSLRRGITVDDRALLAGLGELVEKESGLPLLRINWYDSSRSGVPDLAQQQIAELPRVKVRLGRIGYDGEQKGVDLRIGLDMVSYARNEACDSIYLLSGDDDLSEAVEAAQELGVQVVVLAVPGADELPHAVSKHLRRSADEVSLIPGALLEATVARAEQEQRPEPPAAATTPVVAKVPSPAELAHRTVVPRPTVDVPVAYTSATGGTSRLAPEYDIDDAAIETVVRKAYESWARTASTTQHRELVAGRPQIPRELDRALLIDLSDAIGIYDLSDAHRFALRSKFWDVVTDAAVTT